MRHIKISFQLATPESIEVGDYAETGWHDEEGISCKPEEGDEESAVDLAVDLLESDGPMEPSNWPTWSPGTWYTGPTIEDRAYFEEGHDRRLTYHLYGFSELEEREIYRRVTGREA